MNDKFFDLKKEKQDKMINGAMEIFAKKGYKNASTDDMVKTAGVSKGLWFHYFENKSGLYAFVADYCVKYINMELTVDLAVGPRDYFDILYLIEDTKVRISKMYPFAPLMIQSMLSENDEEIQKCSRQRIMPYVEIVENSLEGFTDEKFSEGVTRDILDMTVSYTLKGILEKSYASGNFDSDYYLGEIQKYFEMMRAIVYA